jgi:hypothetical protein
MLWEEKTGERERENGENRKQGGMWEVEGENN